MTDMKTKHTPDEQNDIIRAQVDREIPKPPGGFETEEDEATWRKRSDRRFFELARAFPNQP